jgi:purine-binding chemotaxis protein CheW
MASDSQATLEQTQEDNQSVAEWMTFSLANVTYAVDILRVREIRTWEQMTRVPYSQPFVHGLINLRGAIVPVVDLRTRFGLAAQKPDKETIVLIMSVHGKTSEKTMGIVVDRISEVVEVGESDIASSTRFDLAIDEKFVRGITDIGGAMALLVNIDTVLDAEEF